MKNQVLVLILIMLSTTFANKVNAQISTDDRIVSLGASVGFYPKYNKEYSEVENDFIYSMPIFIQYEKGYGDGLEIEELDNLLSWGGYFGYCNKEYSRDIKEGEMQNMVKGYHKLDYFMGGIVVSLHYIPLFSEFDLPPLPENLDLYFSLKAGVVVNYERTNYEFVIGGYDILPIDEKNTVANFYAAPQLGAKYLLTKSLGVFTEIGRQNLSWFTMGINYSFNK